MFSRSPFSSAAQWAAGIPSPQDPAAALRWRGDRDMRADDVPACGVGATNQRDREPVAPVFSVGLVVFGLPRLHYAGLRDEEPFVVPMHRITMMTTSAFRHMGQPCSGQRLSIRSPEMPSRRLCLPAELR